MLRKMAVGLLAATMLALAGTSAAAAPVDRRTVVSVEVASDVNVKSHFIDSAITYINKYTKKTRMVRQKCATTVPAKYLCVKVRTGQYPNRDNDWWPIVAAFAQERTDTREGGVWYVEENYNTFSDYTRWIMTTHEFGHVLGLDHADTCNTLMYYTSQCPTTDPSQSSKPVPKNFLYSEKLHLNTR